MSDIRHQSLEDAKTIAATKGQVVRTPAEDELFLDIDLPQQWHCFERNSANLQHLIRSFTKTPSPSQKEHHFHVVVKLTRPVASMSERLFLQLLLGSDPVRECLSWLRYLNGNDTPSVLFELPSKTRPSKRKCKGIEK